MDGTTALKLYFSFSNFSNTPPSLSQDFSTTFAPKLPHTLSYSNTTSTKENSTMKFGTGISNSGAGIAVEMDEEVSLEGGYL